MESLLIFTDLDRTLIPNGHHQESDIARPIFKQLAADKDIILVYVSGRDLSLIKNAVDEFDLPVPDYAIGDVGTSLYNIEEDRWTRSSIWQQTIGADWHGVTNSEISDLLQYIAALTLQEPEKQGPYKVSYYTGVDADPIRLKQEVAIALTACPAEVSLVHSIDEVAGIGLFDILPKRATKLHAVRFLIDALGIAEERAVYSGDSGNDMEVLTSGIRSTLVANAGPEVKEQALELAPDNTLYHAQGGFMSMNGCYCAGILEGLVHFFPEMEEKIIQCSQTIHL